MGCILALVDRASLPEYFRKWIAEVWTLDEAVRSWRQANNIRAHSGDNPPECVLRCDQSVKLAQQLAPERVRLSGQPAAFGVGKTKVLHTQARFEYAVLLLQYSMTST